MVASFRLPPRPIHPTVPRDKAVNGLEKEFAHLAAVKATGARVIYVSGKLAARASGNLSPVIKYVSYTELFCWNLLEYTHHDIAVTDVFTEGLFRN